MWCHKSQVVLVSLYWQQLYDEIISIHEVAICCNKSELILGKKRCRLSDSQRVWDTVRNQEEIMGESALNSIYTVLIFFLGGNYSQSICYPIGHTSRNAGNKSVVIILLLHISQK